MNDALMNYELSEEDFTRFKEELRKLTIDETSFQPFYIKTGIISVKGEKASNYGIIRMRAIEITDFLDGKDPEAGLINLCDGKYTITTSNDSIKELAAQIKTHNIS